MNLRGTAGVAFVSLIVCAFVAARSESDYKTGALVSWGSGGEHCNGVSLGRSVAVGSVNCNLGGDILYKVTSEGREYTLTRGDDNEGLLHSTADPLRSLVPKSEFKYRIDKKQKFMWVVDIKDDGKTKETKYTIRGVE